MCHYGGYHWGDYLSTLYNIEPINRIPHLMGEISYAYNMTLALVILPFSV